MMRLRKETLTERILANHLTTRATIEPGEYVFVNVDLVYSHESTALVIDHFEELGINRIWDKNRIVIVLDHRVPAESVETAETHQKIRSFVSRYNLPHFYDINAGIGHLVLQQYGYVNAGMIIIGADSHTLIHGALGALGIGVGATDVAVGWATGKIWLRIPEVELLKLVGSTTATTTTTTTTTTITAKDISLALIQKFGIDYANYKVIELTAGAEVLTNLSLDALNTLALHGAELGAKSILINPSIEIQEDCYDAIHTIDVSEIEPLVAGPHKLDLVRAVAELEGLHIDQALIGGCAGGKLEDLKLAAKILKGKKVHPDVRLIIIPATTKIYQQAVELGLINIFLNAGAIVLNAGCGPCLGSHQGLLAAGERCISTTTRNFRGRMGSPEAEIFLASPLTVAVSAVKGEITAPR